MDEILRSPEKDKVGIVCSIGASGFVGKLLRQAGIIDNDASYPDLDVTSQESVDRWINTISDGSTIVYLAAYTDVDGAEREPEIARDTNVEGLRRVLKVLEKKKNIFFIYFSTDMVFEASEKNHGPHKEEAIPSGEGIGVYAKTKWEAEQMLKESEIPHAVVRISFPWGGKLIKDDGKPDTRDYVVKLLTAIKKWPMYTNQVVTSTYLPDLAEFLRWLTKERREGIWHVASEPTNPYDLVKFVLEKIGRPDTADAVGKGILVNPEEGSGKSPRPIKGGLLCEVTKDKSGCKIHSNEEAVNEKLPELEEVGDLIFSS